MIYHTVLFKIKESASAEAVEKMITGLNALGSKIKELKFISVNHNFSTRSKGYNVVLMSAFEDKRSLEAYQVHPEHVSAVENYVKPVIDELVVGDIEA